MRILIVDDAAITRTLLRAILERNGHEVNEAATVESGIVQFKAKKPDFVFMDLNLDEDSGIRLFSEVGSSHPEVPFVLITANEQPELERMAADMGIRKILRKPITGKHILQVLEQ